jgi:FAD binding domain
MAAVLKGWADPSLLDSYELERRPVHRRVIDEAVGNQAAHGAVMRPGLEAEGAAGEVVRHEVGELIRQTRRQEFRSLGVVLGYTYAGSPFVATEAAPPPESPSTEYRPSAYPGRLAPHMWLDDGRSLYDLFGAGFTLLVTDEDHGPDVAAASEDAARMGVPLEIVGVPTAGAAGVYEAALVLIRPDQHVAWRGEAWPGAEILARVTGRLGEAWAQGPSDRLDAGSV